MFDEIKGALGDGLLSFPITDMDANGNFDSDSFTDRVNWFMQHEISAVFVAGGTGEFFSISKDEYQQIVKISAKTVGGKAPVISSVGRSIPEAIEFAKIAEEAGIDGLLLMPPYLTGCPQSGLIAYAKTIMENTKLPVVYYNRANGILTSDSVKQLADACPNFIALKDGTGNMQELNETIKTVGNRLTYIGGVPTAEIISEAYLSIGVNTYSSAVFNFVPDLAVSYYKALRKGDAARVQEIIKSFFIPFIRLRSKKAGYAVSLIKAGAHLIGKPAGDVRLPLEMPNQDEIKELKGLIKIAADLV
ncbi:5-dehydro-4-deoxyglucarate dehydratase [Aurantibacter crassamenti]|uniref:5-dehydro-4-deoxyglucarate dehydratase n=1 Tax=Aurantibacter crassamenti TaxID=1837375 RepID=UPI0019396CBF|nr:5-dehydro-4-deoxyglucarate dehydratase [Aurantibacter crassamenti]MBM1105839.1 5-dehydro-4-deoxyglucarate dehydratase [Aurantibacter crassamenti]